MNKEHICTLRLYLVSHHHLCRPCISSSDLFKTAMQQQSSCSGNVKDSNGEPIIGATIRIEGSNGGTVTDLDGNFTLKTSNGS